MTLQQVLTGELKVRFPRKNLLTQFVSQEAQDFCWSVFAEANILLVSLDRQSKLAPFLSLRFPKLQQLGLFLLWPRWKTWESFLCLFQAYALSREDPSDASHWSLRVVQFQRIWSHWATELKRCFFFTPLVDGESHCSSGVQMEFGNCQPNLSSQPFFGSLRFQKAIYSFLKAVWDNPLG